MASNSYRITVDTGGTFTDVVYFAEATGEITIFKLPSTPDDPSRAIIEGVRVLLDQGVKPEQIEHFCHGTTVGTNALLEGKGARTGLLVTKGFRGIYEAQEQCIPYGAAIFDIMYEKPKMLVPQSRTGEVTERVDFTGKVLQDLDEAALRATVKDLAAEGIESMAVCLLFSFLCPSHEQKVRDIIKAEMPDCSVSLSSDVLPQIREYFRLSTTVINAYLQPILERYIHHLGEKLHQAGIETGKRYIMQSNGGTSTFESSAKKAVATVLSGPAGGVTAGCHLARAIGQGNLITFDMGGTSCDVALIKDGQASFNNNLHVDGRVIALPMMDINTVSAGGGTIARADHMAMLEVGPESAGAEPGPACYGKGGANPTVTDCNLVLGYLGESNFLGGRMALDTALALAAIEDKIAGPLDMSTMDAAEGIVRIINVKMEEAIKAISTMRGYDLRDFMLVAFGGAGPLHAGQISENLGMKGVIVPLYPGVNSAIGLLEADVKHDYAASKLTLINVLDAADASAILAGLAANATDELTAEGFLGDQIRLDYALDMRYAGQGYEITIELDNGEFDKGELSASDLEEVRAAFDQRHRQLFGHSAPDELVEVVTYRVVGTGKGIDVELPTFKPSGGTLKDAYLGDRDARFGNQTHATPVYQRERLDVGLEIKGPAVVEQLDATLVINPGQTAIVDGWKNIIISREG